jgi:hypothetical protein
MHEHAILIQKSTCPDSIVSNSNSTGPFRRLFQQHRPTPVIGWIEIPQCSTSCRTEVCLSFRPEAREASSSETARVHQAAWRRGRSVAACRSCAIDDAANPSDDSETAPDRGGIDPAAPMLRFQLSDGSVDLMKAFSLGGLEGIGGVWKMPLSDETFDARYGRW